MHNFRAPEDTEHNTWLNLIYLLQGSITSNARTLVHAPVFKILLNQYFINKLLFIFYAHIFFCTETELRWIMTIIHLSIDLFGNYIHCILLLLNIIFSWVILVKSYNDVVYFYTVKLLALIIQISTEIYNKKVCQLCGINKLKYDLYNSCNLFLLMCVLMNIKLFMEVVSL